MKSKKADEKEKKFSKAQIVNSNKYAKNKDILIAVLREDTTYTKEEVELKLKEFLKRRV